jgi:hypothetical protein
MVRSFPLSWSAKPVLVAVAVILSGCGGGGTTEPPAQTVQATGYRFEAPAGWKVSREQGSAAAASGKVDRIEVRTFRLARPYQPARFRAATRELDSVISQIATQLEGQVTRRRTLDVAGRKARSYVITYGDPERRKTQEITFVLVGRQEHQLSCRREVGADEEPCEALLESFTLR